MERCSAFNRVPYGKFFIFLPPFSLRGKSNMRDYSTLMNILDQAEGKQIAHDLWILSKLIEIWHTLVVKLFQLKYLDS